MTHSKVREAAALTVAGDSKTGRLPIQIITPGWGSSGYYSAEVLENAAKAGVFKSGTKMFLDHPSKSEGRDRPERSVRDLAAVLVEDAVWNGEALVAVAHVAAPFHSLFSDPEITTLIEVSIAAWADTRIGEAEGRKGEIITEITEVFSVDFVTFAGRGGRILTVMESAAVETAASDTWNAISSALHTAYGGSGAWVYLRDYDPDQSLAWFTVEPEGGATTTYQQGYTIGDDDGTVTLDSGDPVEVRARVTYVPVSNVPAPAGQSEATNRGDHMAMTQIEDSVLAGLRQDAERVATLTSDLAEATKRAASAEAELAKRERVAAAETILVSRTGESGASLTSLERRGVLADLPLTETGELDPVAFTELVDAAIAEKTAAAGAGRVSGFGTTTTTESGADPWAEVDQNLGINRKGN